MITIDGAQGEGGGQILRSSVALSAITGTPLHIHNIRAGRKKPGLKRQHATAVNAAAQVCDATIEGATPGSNELTFNPNAIKGGDSRFSMGTAGSTTLVFQTLLPVLLNADQPSTITLEGGTHNPFAPPFDFLQKAYLPQLKRMGAEITSNLIRPGFYPAGGGKLELSVAPCPALKPLELHERGKLINRNVRAIVSNLPAHIAERECDIIRRKFEWKGKDDCCHAEEVDSNGPGNVVMIELQYQHVTELFVAFGEKNRRAEQVARDVARQATAYLKTDVPVGEYLADQLLLPMAIGKANGTGGGSFRTLALSDHSTTHINIIREFLDVDIQVEQIESNNVRVTM